MKGIILGCLGFLAGLSASADVLERQTGEKIAGRVLGYFKQRFEFADPQGTITRPALNQVKRIEFDSPPATILTLDRRLVHAHLVSLEHGRFTYENLEGQRRQIAASQVRDVTVTGKGAAAAAAAAAAPPPAATSPPAPAAAARDNSPASPQAGKVTIVDFYADWCGPCRSIGPVLQEIAANSPDVVLRKVNVDQHGELAQRYNVNGIPHIIVYDKAGRQVEVIVGANARGVRAAVDRAKRGG